MEIQNIRGEDEKTLKNYLSKLKLENTCTTDYELFYMNEKKILEIEKELEDIERKKKVFIKELPNNEEDLQILIKLIDKQLNSLDNLHIIDEIHAKVLIQTLKKRKEQAIIMIQGLNTTKLVSEEPTTFEKKKKEEKIEPKVLKKEKEQSLDMNLCNHTNCKCKKRHVCENKKCNDEKKDHLMKFAHICPKGKECKEVKEENHRILYIHYCSYQNECKNQSNLVHMQRFIHPCSKKGCSETSLDHILMFSHKKKIPKALKQQGYIIQDKENLIKHSKNWKKAAFFEIVHEKKTWDFMGFEMKNKKEMDENKIVLIQKNGRGFAGGYIESFDLTKMSIPNPKIFFQPWDNENVLVVVHQNIKKEFKDILKTNIHGINESYETVIKYIFNNDIPVFIVGGAIRDMILNEKDRTNHPIKDIDIGFGCSASDLEHIITKKYGKGSCSVGPNGLVTIGQKLNDLFLEGKTINGLNNDFVAFSGKSGQIPITIGTDLYHENICRDFTCNSLWYDIINETIIDPTGHGIEDTLNKVLRIPVEEEKWIWWEKGNPSKLLRYWKMFCKGYQPIDQKTKDFIIKRSKEYEKLTDNNKINFFKNFCKSQFKYQSDQKGFENIIKKELGTSFWDKFFK